MIKRFTFRAEELIPLVDWIHFYHAWQVKPGTDEAEELRHEALRWLAEKAPDTVANGIFTEVKAHSDGDNIVVGETHIPLLRQQKPGTDGNTLCLSDFVSPEEDNIGIFATASHIADDNPSLPVDKSSLSGNKSSLADDPYAALLRQTLSTRLAEAAAEKLQHDTMPGIRPAVGYPCMPDLSVLFILDKLCPVREAGIRLTENGAMIPQASVAGFIIPHPQARYFAVGRIGEDQFRDYARRRGMKPDEMKKFLKNTDAKS